MPTAQLLAETTERLARAGCIHAADEARAITDAAAGDTALLDRLVERRCAGEPLAWVIGWTEFDGIRIAITPGVYVPRPHTELLVERAAALLPDAGRAIDLCSGSGALACALAARRPAATIVATDLDPVAVACARDNGVDARFGDRFDPVDPAWRGTVDVVVGVLPYVPTDELAFLARDVREHEPELAHDGGPHGITLLAATIADARSWLRPSGALMLELGGDQASLLEPVLDAHGFTLEAVVRDEDGDPRGIVARLG